DQPWVADLPNGQVDTDERCSRCQSKPMNGLSAGQLQQPATEGDDQSGVFGQVDEAVGSEHAELGMAPSGERLHAADGSVGELDQRLGVEGELVVVQRGGQGGRQLVAGNVASIS